MYFLKYQLPLLVIICGVALSGCMVGPDFHPPKMPAVSSFTHDPLPKKTASTPSIKKGGKAQTYVYGKDIYVNWWYVFRSETLNRLVERGLANSPNLTAAYAALRQAQENFNAQVGSTMLPAFNAQASAQRQLFPGASLGGDIPSNIFNLFNTNVNVSYTLDVFGGLRRQIEALGAQVDFQQFELIGVYIALSANIATTAITIASLKAQIAATQTLLKAEKKQLKIIRSQFRLGGISAQDVLTQETLVAQTMALIPPLEKNLAQNRHALSVLVGAFPNERMPELTLQNLHLPTKIPVSIPSHLVRQRPDVRASEALLHAASANIGVATANLLPQFNLTGYYGWQAPTPSTLFATRTNFWSIATQITQPVFHGGALLAQRRAAIAAYDQAFAQYKQTVLLGFQNVADALRALETDARTLQAERKAELAARSSLRLATDQYLLGGASYLVLLTAEQQYQQTIVNRIRAQASRYTDTVALFQALGGGWWNQTWCVKECLFEK